MVCAKLQQRNSYLKHINNYNYTKTPINANLMNAKPHFEKTNKCKNAMLFGKKKFKKVFRNSQKSEDLTKIKRL